MARKNIIIIVLAFLALFILIAGLFFYLQTSKNNQAESLPVHYYPFGADRFSEKNEVGKIESAKDNPEKDSNGDGILDKEAEAKGLNPYKTDNDGDGIFDIDEINLTKTDPLKADTDGDGLNGVDELNKYKTDPLKADKIK